MKNARTIITISEGEKRWLEAYSGIHGVSQAEAIRRGIACLKATEGQSAYHRLVQQTAGIWRAEDGLTYQQAIRAEWDRET